MSKATLTCSLSAESAKAILDAAEPALPPSSETIEATRRWLESALEEAINRIRAKPLTQKDVSQLENAYVRFRHVVEMLQNCRYPPPLIPTKDCQTDWEYWLTTHRAFKTKRGPHDKVDWRLIGELITLYEVTSGRVASGSQATGPTMRFLEAALSELKNYVPDDLRSYFDSPGAGMIKGNLGALRKDYFKFLRSELAKISEVKGR